MMGSGGMMESGGMMGSGGTIEQVVAWYVEA